MKMVNGKVISYINMKGGVGKTTLCREISEYLTNNFEVMEANGTKRSLNILVIDVDPQSNLTQSMLDNYGKEIEFYKKEDGKKKIDYKCTIDNLFQTNDMTGIEEKHIILDLTENLAIIPGELETVFLQRQQHNSTAMKLRDLIIEKELRKKYDLIFLDCPPTYSIYTEMSFYTSDYYIVPAIPDAYSSLGVDLLERVVDDIVKGQRNGIFGQEQRPKNLGVIWTRVDSKQKPRQDDYRNALLLSEVVKEKGIVVFENTFNESNKLSTSSFEKTIIDRQDTKLSKMMHGICRELIEKIEVYEDDDKTIVEKE